METLTSPSKASRRSRTRRAGLRFVVMALATIGLSTSLIITTTTSAEALNVGPIIKGAAKVATVVGGVGVTVGEGAVVANPIGATIITTLAVGYGAYELYDMWQGMNQDDGAKTMRDYGAADPTWTAPAQGYGPVGSGNRLKATVVSVTANKVTLQIECTGAYYYSGWNTTICGTSPGDERDFHPGAQLSPAKSTVANCRTSAGAIVPKTLSGTSTWGSTVSFTSPVDAGHAPVPWVKNVTYTMCGASETLTGFMIPPQTGQVGATYMQNFGIAWGDLQDVVVPLDDPVTFDRWNVDAECTNGGTGETTHLTSYTEDPTGYAIPSCRGRLGDGWRLTGLTVTPTKPKVDGEPVPDTWDVPDFLPAHWDEEIPDEMQQPCIKSANGCQLDIFIDGKRCSTVNPECATWTKVAEKDADRVNCEWGAKIVGMLMCSALANAYKTGTTTTVTTGDPPPDTDVDTCTKTEGATVCTTPNPEGCTGTCVDPPGEQGECFPKGWGMFNPVEWVYKPVKCAITWAFEPKDSFSDRMARMRGELDNKPPFSWVMSLGTLTAAIPGGSCPDWEIHVGSVNKQILCGTQFGNAMRSARPVWAVLMVGAAFWPMIRSVMYASFPIVKPHPSGGE